MHPEEDLINGYVDGGLGALERTELERHLEACSDCRQLVADLSEIRRLAASLEPRDPPARVWQRLERAIQLEERETPDSSRSTRAAGGAPVFGLGLLLRKPAYAWLAAAAALMLVTAVGVGYRLTSHPAPASAARATTAPNTEGSAEAVEAELRAAESHYERAIQGLEQIAGSEQSSLDPKTAATLRKNLAVIDQAISESRAAVRAEPSSEPAANSLMENFKTKLALLQDTVALINEMRKGNEAGTAKAVSGLKQKGD
jgi:anti-sigma factor RsiW